MLVFTNQDQTRVSGAVPSAVFCKCLLNIVFSNTSSGSLFQISTTLCEKHIPRISFKSSPLTVNLCYLVLDSPCLRLAIYPISAPHHFINLYKVTPPPSTFH